MTSRFVTLTLLASALCLCTSPASSQERRVEIALGLDESGQPTQLWLDALKRRLPAERISRIATTYKPLTTEERAWLDLVTQVARVWTAALPGLDAPFRHVSPPVDVTILAGNQGANDGFTHQLDIICTDLSDLVRNYGFASNDVNRDRVFRILSHEYTHLLTKAWLEDRPWRSETPLLLATWELYYEGLGNLYSLTRSHRWVGEDQQLTDLASSTIGELEPILLERLQGLAASPTPAEADRLRENLSSGPFRYKWGALPVALWLAADTGYDPDKIAEWVERGPGGILELVVMSARPENRDAFRELQAKVVAQSAHSR